VQSVKDPQKEAARNQMIDLDPYKPKNNNATMTNYRICTPVLRQFNFRAFLHFMTCVDFAPIIRPALIRRAKKSHQERTVYS
jgi:hypothetical protein